MPFTVTVGAASPGDSDFRNIDVVVDTGAAHSFLPASFLESLGVPRTRTRGFKLADRTRKTYDLGEARFRIEGREMNSPVVFGDEDVCLLGATTLGIFDLIADTRNRRLIDAPEALLVSIFRS